jgi:hypothetical protein
MKSVQDADISKNKEPMVRLAKQKGLSASSAQIATHVSHLYPHKATVAQALCDTDRAK